MITDEAIYGWRERPSKSNEQIRQMQAFAENHNLCTNPGCNNSHEIVDGERVFIERMPRPARWEVTTRWARWLYCDVCVQRVNQRDDFSVRRLGE